MFAYCHFCVFFLSVVITSSWAETTEIPEFDFKSPSTPKINCEMEDWMPKGAVCYLNETNIHVDEIATSYYYKLKEFNPSFAGHAILKDNHLFIKSLPSFANYSISFMAVNDENEDSKWSAYVNFWLEEPLEFVGNFEKGDPNSNFKYVFIVKNIESITASSAGSFNDFGACIIVFVVAHFL